MMTNRKSTLTTVVSYPERGQGGNNRYRGNCSPIPVTQTRLTSIWQKQPRPGAIWPTSRQYPRANGRRPLPLVSLFEMPASDFSSAQPVIPLTLRPWTNWEASSGAGRTSPRRRHMKCQRQQPLRQPRRPPQNQ